MRCRLPSWTVPALGLIVAAMPARAAWEGRYVGLWSATDNGSVDTQSLQHRYDATTQETFGESVNGKLHVSLRYRNRPGEGNTDLLQSRFQGDLRSRNWRLYGQVSPWQDRATGTDRPRELYRQAGLDWTTIGGARLSALWQKRDGESVLGRTAIEDKQVQLAQAVGPVRWTGQWRRLDSGTPGGADGDRTTEEWRGGLTGSRNWGGVSVQSSWDGVFSRLTLADGRQDTRTHRMDLGAAWRPHRTVNVRSNAQARLGRTEITGRSPLTSDERTYTGAVTWRPWTSLDLQFGRDYRRQERIGGIAESDYLRFESRFRRTVYRNVRFHTGYQRTFDLQDEIGVPNNVVYGQLEGPLREGLTGRAELRVSESAGSFSTGRLWRRLLQVRANPTPDSQLDVTWQEQDFPEIQGQAQMEQEWRLTGSFRPTPTTTLAGTYVTRDGRGRIDRDEKLETFSAAWKPGRQAQVSVEGSRRATTVQGKLTRNRVLGTDVTFWVAGQTRIVGSARRLWTTATPVTRIVSVSVEKTFR